MDSRQALLTAGGIALNLTLAKLAVLLSLPMYFDSVATIISVALLPWYLSVTIAIGTSLLGSIIIDPHLAAYCGTQHAFMILSGKVNAICTKGETSRVICQFGPGQFVGGCALLGRLPRLFTLQATEETAVLRLSREEFQKTVQRFPHAISQITGNLVSELAGWDRNLMEASKVDNELEFQALGVSLL